MRVSGSPSINTIACFPLWKLKWKSGNTTLEITACYSCEVCQYFLAQTSHLKVIKWVPGGVKLNKTSSPVTRETLFVISVGRVREVSVYFKINNTFLDYSLPYWRSDTRLWVQRPVVPEGFLSSFPWGCLLKLNDWIKQDKLWIWGSSSWLLYECYLFLIWQKTCPCSPHLLLWACPTPRQRPCPQFKNHHATPGNAENQFASLLFMVIWDLQHQHVCMAKIYYWKNI